MRHSSIHRGPLSVLAPAATPLALCLAAWTGACSPQADPADVLDAPEVLVSLLERPELRTTVQEHPKFGLRVDIMRPRKQQSETGVLGALPAIEVTPPCEVVFDLPPTPDDALLDFAVGIIERNYRDEGSVRYEFELDGEPAFEWTVPSSRSVDRLERKWHPAQVPLHGARKLTIRTHYEGTCKIATRSAIAELAVLRPRRVERARPSPSSPNVVLVVIDTLRADRLSAYGNTRPVSPSLDALAARGTLFERAYTPAPWTVPSTAAIMTSLSPAAHGIGLVRSNYLPNQLDTLAEAFQLAGLTTGGFSCNPLISVARNFDQGFESFHDYRWRRGEEIAEDVLAWLDANHERRFFLYLHPTDPHDPYGPPEDFAIEGPERPEGYDDATMARLMKRYWDEGGLPDDFMRQVAEYNLALYDGEIAAIDHILGRVFAKLRELGLEDETIVAVTSDHGEEFVEHGLMGHSNQLHAESHHVPLMVAGPGVPAGERIPVRVENRFVGPTLLALANVAPFGTMDGVNLFDPEQRAEHARSDFHRATGDGWIRDPATSEWKSVKRLHGLRRDDWLFFWAPKKPDANEEYVNLYDLSTDPAAQHDVSAENPDVVAELLGTIKDMLAKSAKNRAKDAMEGAQDRAEMHALGYVGDD